ncbi:hypothetical protein VA603_08965, partial [Stenotrophomonas sp. MH1]
VVAVPDAVARPGLPSYACRGCAFIVCRTAHEPALLHCGRSDAGRATKLVSSEMEVVWLFFVLFR